MDWEIYLQVVLFIASLLWLIGAGVSGYAAMRLWMGFEEDRWQYPKPERRVWVSTGLFFLFLFLLSWSVYGLVV